MKRRVLVLAFAVAHTSSIADELAYELTYKPASTKYVIYGQDLSDPKKPTKVNSKIAFSLSGRAAKEMFEAMPPDRDIKCTDDADFRFRSRDSERLVCTYYQSEYSCSFGFDLVTGKSIGGGDC